MNYTTISAEELAKRQGAGEGVHLVDVRTPAEYREVHADIAQNVPLDRLDPDELMKSRNDSTDQSLYMICRSGSRGQQACQKLVAAGYENIVNVKGGTQAWEAAGLPVIRGQKTISLERQVRIAAGCLVLLGIALAWVHPAFLALSAFVGAGLVFAGITDTCGMGMLLAKMPWNQATTECKDNQCSV
jgi:rhodanese-related sulfurtransferase